MTRTGAAAARPSCVAPLAANTAREVEHVLGLEPEVELLDDLLGEQLHERGRVGERRDRDAARPATGRATPAPQVGARRARRPVARCTFTTTSSPVTSRAACTWAIDAAASGCPVELGEHRLERTGPGPAWMTARTSANGSGGTWSRQLLELVDELVGEQALAGRDDLGELDVGGAELAPSPDGSDGRGRPAGRTGRPGACGGGGTRPRRHRVGAPSRAGDDWAGSGGGAAGPAPAGASCGGPRRCRRATASRRARRATEDDR